MIALVGCGFLGSLFAEEWAKRAFAFQEGDAVMLVDFDKFEERNCANQNVTRAAANKQPNKVDYLADKLKEYGLYVIPNCVKVDSKNVKDVLKDATTLVSALDNIEARDELWMHALYAKVPLLNLGISQMGTGKVEWTTVDHDQYGLSPVARINMMNYTEKNVTLKPCELIGFRGLGLNMGIAAAKALGIFKGLDPEKSVKNVKPGTLTAWSADMTSHQLSEVHAP